MKRTALLLLLAAGCAHAPAREPLPLIDGALSCDTAPCTITAPQLEEVRTDNRTASMTVIRGAAVDAMLGVLRPSGSILDQKLVGAPAYLGTIDYTDTSKTNHQATTPFNNTGNALCGKLILLQPTTAVYILGAITNAGTVTSANGVELQAKERVVIMFLDNTQCWLAALRVSSSGDLKFWELK